MMEPQQEAAMTVESAVGIISQWDSTAVTRDFVFDGYRKEINQYLLAVDTVQRSIESATTTDDMHEAKSVIRLAMHRLGDEFGNILMLNNKNAAEQHKLHNPSSAGSETYSSNSMTDSCSNYESQEEEFREGSNATSTDAMNDLRSIAERMNSAGYLDECIQVYLHVRKNYVNATLLRLNFQNFSIQSVQRLEWELLEKLIKEWIKSAKICVRVLFANEKRFVEVIFGGLGKESDDGITSYLEIVKYPAIQLFDFAEAISCVHPSYEKLFRLLDVYETLSDLLSQVNSLFQSHTLYPIQVHAAKILGKLTDAIRKSLLKFEKAVVLGHSKTIPGMVAIHPLTRYAMNYISKICDYEQTLMELIVCKPSRDISNLTMGIIEFEGQTPLSIHLNWIIIHLDYNLEGKSKHYEDASLGCLFTMNNVHFIVQMIERHPQLREMTAYYYLNELTVKFDRAKAEYLKLTTEMFLYCLRDEGLALSVMFSSRILKSTLRQRLKSFESLFDKLLKTLAQSVELDVQILMNLQINILRMLIPAYSSFLEWFRSNTERCCIKYSAKDIETKILLLTPPHQIPHSLITKSQQGFTSRRTI